MLTTHLQLEPMLGMNGAIFSLYALLAWKGTGTAVPCWHGRGQGLLCLAGMDGDRGCCALLAGTGTAVPFWRRCACGLIDCLSTGILTDPVDTAVQRPDRTGPDRCHLRTNLKVIKLKYRINPVYLYALLAVQCVLSESGCV
jgi:hypothetical protein